MQEGRKEGRKEGRMEVNEGSEGKGMRGRKGYERKDGWKEGRNMKE